jgi:hypothetical protein
MAYGDKNGNGKKKKPCRVCEGKNRNPPMKKAKSGKEGEVDFDSIKEGALKKQLGYADDKRIPKNMLEKIKRTKVGQTFEVNGKTKKATDLLHKRVNFALNFGYKKKK